MIRPDGRVPPEKLTGPQRKELRAQWDRGPQHTYGRFRARTQNVLVERGLSIFLGEDGKPATVDGFYMDRDTCTITPHGIGVLCGCGGFVQMGAYVHADGCADRKTRKGWPKALRPRQAPLPSKLPPFKNAREYGEKLAHRLEAGLAANTSRESKEGVVLLREPFKVNKRLVRESIARADARDAERPGAVARLHGTARQECLLGVFWTGLNDADDHGRGHNEYRGMVQADLGLDAVPVPPFTDREMQDIMFAAKMAALKLLRDRKKKTSQKC